MNQWELGRYARAIRFVFSVMLRFDYDDERYDFLKLFTRQVPL
ncbi:hypothetical protein [Ammoniphilus oxalaticus]|nr:hypothetical protein [Ammoniphilus oxalaticus]